MANCLVIVSIILITVLGPSVAISADSSESPSPKQLLEAIQKRSDELRTVAFTYRRGVGLRDTSVRWGQRTYRVRMNRPSYYIESPSVAYAYDGTTSFARDDNVAAVSVAFDAAYAPGSKQVDPRYVGSLPPHLGDYMQEHLERVQVAIADTSPDQYVMRIEVPESDLAAALDAWPEACREGAVVSVWIDTSHAPVLTKMEWRGAEDSSYSGILGQERIWGEWQEISPGQWMPIRYTLRNYGPEGSSQPPVFTLERAYSEIDGTPTFNPDAFTIPIPAGFHVNDQRIPGGMSYMAGQAPEQLLDLQALDHLEMRAQSTETAGAKAGAVTTPERLGDGTATIPVTHAETSPFVLYIVVLLAGATVLLLVFVRYRRRFLRGSFHE